MSTGDDMCFERCIDGQFYECGRVVICSRGLSDLC
jgi:hypothetical protein